MFFFVYLFFFSFIRHVTITPYRPQADGQIESLNRTIKHALYREMGPNGEWSDLLPTVTNYYNRYVPFQA